MKEIRKLVAGNSSSWVKSFTDYKASEGWVLKYSIVNQTNSYLVNTTANGDDFNVAISATSSANFAPGKYKLFGYVAKGEERKTVYSGELTINPDFTSAADMRSWAEKTLDAIEAVIQNTATKDQQQVTVDGQTLVRRSIPDLLILRDRVRREVFAKRRAEGRKKRGHIRRVLVRNN